MTESSVPWKSITDIAVSGILLKPSRGDPEIGAIEATILPNSEATIYIYLDE